MAVEKIPPIPDASHAIANPAGLTTSDWYFLLQQMVLRLAEMTPFKVPTYTVVTLPAATTARVAFASNGRKVGEGAGGGTGTLVYADGTAWRRVGDDTAVAD
jgi:hypothetical protein